MRSTQQTSTMAQTSPATEPTLAFALKRMTDLISAIRTIPAQRLTAAWGQHDSPEARRPSVVNRCQAMSVLNQLSQAAVGLPTGPAS